MTMEKEQPVFCEKLLKAPCGLLKSALLFCKKFGKDIREISFEINLHDPCVANRMVNDKQQTMVLHAGDVKVNHIDSDVNNKFIQFIKEKHEDEKGRQSKSHPWKGP